MFSRDWSYDLGYGPPLSAFGRCLCVTSGSGLPKSADTTPPGSYIAKCTEASSRHPMIPEPSYDPRAQHHPRPCTPTTNQRRLNSGLSGACILGYPELFQGFCFGGGGAMIRTLQLAPPVELTSCSKRQQGLNDCQYHDPHIPDMAIVLETSNIPQHGIGNI